MEKLIPINQKEKIMKLIKEVKYPAFPGGRRDFTMGIQHPDHVFELVAEHLIANGVVVMQQKEKLE